MHSSSIGEAVQESFHEQDVEKRAKVLADSFNQVIFKKIQQTSLKQLAAFKLYLIQQSKANPKFGEFFDGIRAELEIFYTNAKTLNDVVRLVKEAPAEQQPILIRFLGGEECYGIIEKWLTPQTLEGIDTILTTAHDEKQFSASFTWDHKEEIENFFKTVTSKDIEATFKKATFKSFQMNQTQMAAPTSTEAARLAIIAIKPNGRSEELQIAAKEIMTCCAEKTLTLMVDTLDKCLPALRTEFRTVVKCDASKRATPCNDCEIALESYSKFTVARKMECGFFEQHNKGSSPQFTLAVTCAFDYENGWQSMRLEIADLTISAQISPEQTKELLETLNKALQ